MENIENSPLEQPENITPPQANASFFTRLKGNWPIVLGALGSLVLFTAIIYAAYSYSRRGQEVQPTPTTTLRLTPSVVITPSATSTVTLPITELKTTLGIEGPEAPTYPTSITVNVPIEYKNQLAAYGVAYEVIIGPKGWIGHGSVGADGNRLIELYPADGTWQDDSKITVFIASTGTGSALFEAASYSPWLQSHGKDLGLAPIPSLIPGLHIVPIATNLSRYTLPNTPEGSEVNGVVFSDAQDHMSDSMWAFTKMEVVLSPQHHDLATGILEVFIDEQKLSSTLYSYQTPIQIMWLPSEQEWLQKAWQYRVSLKIPAGWTANLSKDYERKNQTSVIISNGEYQVNLGGIGAGAPCNYKDLGNQSVDPFPGGVRSFPSYYKINSGLGTLARIKIADYRKTPYDPSTLFFICQKYDKYVDGRDLGENTYLDITPIGYISYGVPESPDEVIIKEMDGILSSIKIVKTE